ncbi:MAG: aminotransferase class III-fold pyridoxal phosphate-dependent enzyme, partial [Terracoccus sp.]
MTDTSTTVTTQHELDARAVELDAHVFHSWSAQAKLSPFVIAGGEGSRVWDHSGRGYLDFSSQLVNVNIGHQHPAVIAAIQAQAATLTTIAPSTINLARGEAAKRIVDRAPEGFNKVFFTNGGADANENAIRMARLHTGRDKVLSTYRSYHGNTGAAVVATGDWRRVPNEFARGHVHFFGPYLYRSEFWATTPEQETERALRHLERVIQPNNYTAPIDLSDIVLVAVKQVDKGQFDVSLGTPVGLKGATDAGSGAKKDPRMVAFEAVLERLNDLFGSEDFTQEQKVSFLEALLRTLLSDDALVQQAKVNT